MFIGHFALGFAAKRAAPRRPRSARCSSLRSSSTCCGRHCCCSASSGSRSILRSSGAPLDFDHYPISHSLLGAIGWGAVAGRRVFRGDARSARGAWVVGLLVVSHWVLDLLVHRPDLPLLFAGGPRLGLGLWDWPWVELGLELALFAACFAVYLRTPAGQSAGCKPWVLAVLLLAIQIANAVRPAAAIGGSHRVGRPGAVAARRGGLLGRPTGARTTGLRAGDRASTAGPPDKAMTSASAAITAGAALARTARRQRPALRARAARCRPAGRHRPHPARLRGAARRRHRVACGLLLRCCRPAS